MKHRLWPIFLALCLALTLGINAAASPAFSGNGTADDPWLITSAEDLSRFAELVNSGTSFTAQHVKLTADIDLNHTDWIPIGTAAAPFLGSFDGGGHTVRNLNVTADTDAGFFGCIGALSDPAGTVQELTLEKITVNCGRDSVGALAGFAYAEIRNIHVKDASISGQTAVGGLIGDASRSAVYNCTVDQAVITGTGSQVGGIAGRGYCTIDSCYADITLTGPEAAGGIIGSANGCIVTNNYAAGVIRAAYQENAIPSIGGIVGLLSETHLQIVNRNYCNVDIDLTAVAQTTVCPVIGACQVSASDTTADLNGNAWSRAYFDCEAFTVLHGTTPVSFPRNNALIAQEDDLRYITATSADAVTVLDYSRVIPDFTPVSAAAVEEAVSRNNPVAIIGDTSYTTLQHAMDAAAPGDTITLITDLTTDVPITVAPGQRITLDLNGCTVSRTQTNTVTEEDQLIANSGDLTVCDTSEENCGKLVYTYQGEPVQLSISTVRNLPGSALTLQGGAIMNGTAADNGSYAYAIDSQTQGASGPVCVTIQGGTVRSNYMGIRQFINSVSDPNTLNVTGGTIHGEKRGVNIHYLRNNTAVMKITGGRISGGEYALCALTSSSNLTITGGSFDGALWYSGTSGFISGGSYTSDVSTYCQKGYTACENSDGTFRIIPVPVEDDTHKECASGKFTDVPPYGNWAHNGIDFAVKNGLMNGMTETTFVPNGTVTRGQIVTILYRLAGSPPVSGSHPFTDAPQRWYQNAIIWAVDAGITKGTAADTFSPEEPCTREQVAVFLYRYAAIDGNVSAGVDLIRYPDNTEIHSYARSAMSWAVAEGLINGISRSGKTYLDPLGTATRAQLSAIIMRFAD